MKMLSTLGAFVAVSSAAFGFASDLPKEGKYDFTACISGAANTIKLSDTYSVATIEQSGTTLSNPPGGMFDKGAFHCLGMNTSLEGKTASTTFCEVAFVDGGKILLKFSPSADGKIFREAIAGTGKYEGLVSTGTVEPLGPFPLIKAGTFQLCNHQTGTYKLK